MKKKVYILASVLMILMVACSAPASTDNSGEVQSLQARVTELEKENEDLKAQLNSVPETAETEAVEGTTATTNETLVSVGDVINTDTMEITINKIELTYDVLPDDTSSFYNHYEADAGNVYVHIDTDIKNLAKQNLACDEILKATVDYNNGYTYSMFAVPEDTSTGFTYANITSIKPLETLGVHFLAKCPQEVEESDNPLSVTLEPSGTKDTYTIIIR